MMPSGYEPIELTFRKGQISSKDPSKLPLGSFAEMTNFWLDLKNVPTKIPGITDYNVEVGTNKAVKGGISWTAEDSVEYAVIAANGKLYWTNGNGTMTAVKFATANEDVAINTDSYDYEFLVFPVVTAGTQKFVVYVVAPVYPFVSNTPSTGNTENQPYARALRLEVTAGVVHAKLIFSAASGAGTDELAILNWPKQGRIILMIFERIVIANFAEGKNNWAACDAQNGESWTGSSVGGGKQPEEFTMGLVKDSTIYLWTKSKLCTVLATASSISNWREVWVNTNYGCIGLRCASVHNDGFVHYISDKGECRTDGRMVEIADYDIEDTIKALPQLVPNKFSWEQTSKSDWDAGTPINGDNLLDTTDGILKQKAQAIPARVNVCLNKTTSGTASGTSAIVDGNDATACSMGNGKTAQIDLGAAHDSKYVKIVYGHPFSWTGRTLRVRVSANGSDWTTLDTLSVTSAGVYTVNLAVNASIRYIDFLAATSSADKPVYLYECYGYDLTANIVFDYGATPTSFGNLTANMNINGSSTPSVSLFISSSADNITYGAETELAAFTASGNNTAVATGPTLARYLKVRIVEAVFINGTPYLETLYSGAQWVSPIHNIGYVPGSWGVLDLDNVKNGQTANVEMDTSTSPTFATSDGYATISPGTIPANTLRQYIRYRVTLNTTDYTQIPLANALIQYWYKTGQSDIKPCMFSDGDNLYLSCRSLAGTVNDHTWIGQTRTELEQKTQSTRSGAPYPEWCKSDIYKANVFFKFKGILCYGDSSKGIIKNIAGYENAGTAFTATLVTGAISFRDVEGIWRELYMFSKSDHDFSIYVRTRSGVNNWSAWSSANTIALAPLISRSELSILSGLVDGDFVQFKIETAVTDANLELQGMLLYAMPKVRS